MGIKDVIKWVIDGVKRDAHQMFGSKVGILLYTVMIAVTSVTVTLVTTGNYNTTPDCVRFNSEQQAKLNTFIDTYYKSDKIDKDSIVDDLISGYVRFKGDKYSMYVYKQDELESLALATEGETCGIGVVGVESDNGFKIIQVIKDGGASEAGIVIGDTIESVGNVSLVGKNVQEMASDIRGKENESVSVTVKNVHGEEREVNVVRKNIKVENATYRKINDNVGYIRISQFSSSVADDVKKSIDKFRADGCSELVLDLRSNSGGYVVEATKIAEMFMRDCKIADCYTTLHGEHSYNAKWNSDENGLYDINIVILVNENTASASEILTGAFKCNKSNCKIVGNTTYGKGIICDYVEFGDHTRMIVSSGEYTLPNGESINNVGIKPDVEVSMDYTIGKNLWEMTIDEDRQLKSGIEALEKMR